MMDWLIFAEGATDVASQDTSSSVFQMMLWMFILFGVMWFIMIRPQQREQKRRQAMWDSLKKLDKVVTIGGIHGTITDMDREKGIVTLRIDEANNTKIRIWSSSVGEILSDEKEEK